MLEEFSDYVSNYDMSVDAIKRKYEHSIRVMNLSVKYARLLGFSDEDVELASIIGLLHDIGRFEQYTKYQSFNDYKTFDHALYGVKILFKNNFIRKFTDRVKDYGLIKFAIRNHNKLEIEKCNSKRYLKFAKLIRDVDKLDIVYLAGYLGEIKSYANGDLISDSVIDDINNNRLVNKRNILNHNDNIVVYYGFVFDINNDIVLKELKQNLYYLYKRVGGRNTFKEIYDKVIKYVDERIEENAREEI